MITVTVDGKIDAEYETEEDAIRDVVLQAGIEYIRKFSLWLFGDHSEPLSIATQGRVWYRGDVMDIWTYES